MSNDSAVRVRSISVYIIASVCVLTALLQLVSGFTVLRQPDGQAFLATTDGVTTARTLMPLGFAVLLNLATGVAVYLMRVEAVACLGFLLARLLARMAEAPFQLVGALDLFMLLALLYFVMPVFKDATTPGAQRGWKRPSAMLMLGLAVGHLTILFGHLNAYFTLVNVGSMRPIALFAALIGCAALYVAVLVMQSHPARAQKFFILAALSMGLSLAAWGYTYRFSSPMWLGVPLAVWGFWQAHRLSRQVIQSVPEA